MRNYLVIIGMLLTVLAYSQDTLTVDRLDYRFVSYENGVLEPIISLEDTDIAGVLVSCEKDLQIEFCGKNPFDIWVDGRLVLRKNRGQNCEYLSLDKLCQIAQRDTLYISVVSDNKLNGVRARTFTIRESKQDAFEILRRKRISEFVYFGFVGCFLAIVILKINYQKGKLSFRKPNLQSFNDKFLSVDNLILQLVTLLIMAFSIAIYRADPSIYRLLSTFFYVLMTWGILIIITWISASIFNFKKLMNWQIIFSIKFAFLLSIIVFLIQFVDRIVFAGLLVSDRFLIWLMVSSLVAFLWIVIYVSISQRGLKSLHIFIYLCSTELLPISLIIYRLLE